MVLMQNVRSIQITAADNGNPFGGNGSFMMGGSGGFDMGQGMPQQYSRGRTPKKGPSTHHTLSVNLEDLYCGTTKRMRITSKKIDANGGIIRVAVEKEIVVKAGWKDGTKITYENEGDESPGMLPADVVFVLQTKQHPNFERHDDDLIYTVSKLHYAFNLKCFLLHTVTSSNNTHILPLTICTPVSSRS